MSKKLRVLDVGHMGWKGTNATLEPRNISHLSSEAQRLGYDACRLTIPVAGVSYTVLVLARDPLDSRAPEHFIQAPALPPRLGLFSTGQDKAVPFLAIDLANPVGAAPSLQN